MPTLRMPNINQVALSGRLVQEPDFRFMDNGAARLRGRIARQPLLSRPQPRMAGGDLLLRHRPLAESRRDLGQTPAQGYASLYHRPACKATLGAMPRRPASLPRPSARCATCKF